MKSAIVGCGAIAKVHAKILKEQGGCSLNALADTHIEKARLLAQEYGDVQCRCYESLDEMCSKEEIDILHICTPHYLHVPMAIYALEKKISVFMEKPPAITREQFKQLQQADKKGVVGICFQNRYNTAVKAVQELLNNSEMGRIKGARAFVTWSRSKEYYEESEWRGTLGTEGGGVLMNQTIHTLDLLVYFLGKPKLTEATIHNRHLKGSIEVEDTVEAYIEFGDIPVLFYGTTAYCGNSPVFLEIQCEKAAIRMEGAEISIHYSGDKVEKLNLYKGDFMGKDYWGEGHKACIRDFYSSLEEGKEFPVNLNSVKDSFELMMGIYQSAKENQRIYFRQDN